MGEHLPWCGLSYELADGGTWHDPFDCEASYRGPDERVYEDAENMMLECGSDAVARHLYGLLVAIAGVDWARHSTVWTLGLNALPSWAGGPRELASAEQTRPFAAQLPDVN